MPSLEPVMKAFQSLYPASADWSKPFKLLDAVRRVRAQEDAEAVAKSLRIKSAKLEPLLVGDPIKEFLGTSWAEAGDSHPKNAAARKNLGQMVLGHLAEQAFEDLYQKELGASELKLKDFRNSRNETDYRVLDKDGHGIFRINIKFHGTQFRKAKELVGLDPEDCFALATYKIWQAHNKSKVEKLPYVFLVVSAPITGESVGGSIPDDFARFATILRASTGVDGLGKRDLEDAMARYLIGSGTPTSFVPVRDNILAELKKANWRAISAERAKKLVHTLLFDRVYAVRVRAFAQNYGKAELDMHFSLSQDMTTLHDFLKVYTEGGVPALTAQLYGGDI